MLMMLALRLAESVQSLGRIAHLSGLCKARRSEREVERKSS